MLVPWNRWTSCSASVVCCFAGCFHARINPTLCMEVILIGTYEGTERRDEFHGRMCFMANPHLDRALLEK